MTYHVMRYLLLTAGVNETTSFDELTQIADTFVEKVQTGAVAQTVGVEVVSLQMSDPVPPPVDPTGGVRATNETGNLCLELFFFFFECYLKYTLPAKNSVILF